MQHVVDSALPLMIKAFDTDDDKEAVTAAVLGCGVILTGAGAQACQKFMEPLATGASMVKSLFLNMSCQTVSLVWSLVEQIMCAAVQSPALGARVLGILPAQMCFVVYSFAGFALAVKVFQFLIAVRSPQTVSARSSLVCSACQSPDSPVNP